MNPDDVDPNPNSTPEVDLEVVQTKDVPVDTQKHSPRIIVDGTDIAGLSHRRESFRAINGQRIIGEKSLLNARPWWDIDSGSSWYKLGDAEFLRDIDFVHGGDREIRAMGISLRGTKHQYRGEENQDAFRLSSSKHAVVVAVSDGVSAARLSGYVARSITHRVVREIGREIDSGETLPNQDSLRKIALSAVEMASDAVQTWSADEFGAPIEASDSVSLKELAATLTLAIIPHELSDQGTRSVLVGFVGDSPCYTFGPSGWKLHTPATKDDLIVSNATSALPKPVGSKIEINWIGIELEPESVLAVMTDGVSTSLTSTGNSEVGSALSELLRGKVLATDFIDVVSFDRRGEDDDRTIVIVGDYQFFAQPEISEDSDSQGNDSGTQLPANVAETLQKIFEILQLIQTKPPQGFEDLEAIKVEVSKIRDALEVAQRQNETPASRTRRKGRRPLFVTRGDAGNG